MTFIMFEDQQWQQFAPLVQARPLFELRCGGFTLRERLNALLPSLPGGTPGENGAPPAGLCRPYLMSHYGMPEGVSGLLRDSAPLTLINGRALDLHWLPDLLAEPIDTVYETNGVLLGARLSPALGSAVLYYLRDQQTDDALAELRRFARVRTIDTILLNYPWDLVTFAGEQLIRDLPLFALRLPSYTPTQADITVQRSDHVYVAQTARLDGPLVLDARDGPIVIDDNAHVEPFSFIQGPAYIGPGSLIASARIRAETSIGPICRVGGEVEASVIQGFSNKHHEGFLGHSWIGEWVNIGAMTTNSDLKNTYGSVRVTIEGMGQIDSGVLKLGCFLADHVKLGIGLHLNGGTVIGMGSNVFGMHFAPKTVPPFTWGGEIFREYRIDNMIEVTRKVMSRRKQTMSPEYEDILRSIFWATRDTRVSMAVPLPTTTARRDTNDLLLANAEAEALKAYELSI